MARKRVLVVDDEEDILELIGHNLKKEGYDVQSVATGEEALRAASENIPDLIVLDLMLPGVDGLEVCRRLKEDPDTRRIPIIILSAKGDEADIVTGLELGADDYVPKPFSPRVLVARIRAVLRRKKAGVPPESEVLQIHDLVINPGKHKVTINGKKIDLTYTEFYFLSILARRPGWVFTRYQLVDAVRGNNYPVTDRSVDVQIVGLRKKLGKYGNLIETVRGVGYRFKEEWQD
ncbi:transcriptional regulatory protein YycF [bacterium BMS3Abin05]|nr:transcriptional regulatory protein YycF [bacterium BMS3Abin05]GBE28270.1 transcriptional regulatory protein YycF [bacterium BMS3Bbin03]HDK35391.1 response regulator transcription factor [Bacteroidota bacterium]